MRNFNADPEEIKPLTASGSARRYFRITYKDGYSIILCVSDNIKENKTFIELTEYFNEKGIRVPEILDKSSDHKSYILKDLGHISLLDFIHNDNIGAGERFEMIDKCLVQLCKMQFLKESEWNHKVEFQPFDKKLIEYDFNYARIHFFSRFDLKFDETSFSKELKDITDKILSFPDKLWGFMYRDFQSRNVMIWDNQPWFIDYQSGRKGPCIYDFVSFAWQAKAGFTAEERRYMLNTYYECIKSIVPIENGVLQEYVPYFAVLRLLQVLGAYGLRGLTEGKPHFIHSIPLALTEFGTLLRDSGLSNSYPTLNNIVATLEAQYRNIREV